MTTIRQNSPRPNSRLQYVNDPDPNIFKNPAQLEYVRTLVNALRQMDEEMLSAQTAASSVLLTSPNGSTFRVTANNDGTLNVVNARG